MTTHVGHKFTNITLTEFNKKYSLEANSEMTIHEFTDYLEDNDLSYFYASYSEEDVLNCIKEEWDVAEHLKMDYLCVDGLYIAIY